MPVLEEKVSEEVRQRYETKETFDLIEGFLVRQPQLSSTKALAFEQHIAAKTAKVSERDRGLGVIAVRLCELKNRYLLLRQVMETKLANLVRSMIYGLNNHDYVLLALCSRALVEDAALLSYIVQQARKEDVEALHGLYGRSLYSTRFFAEEGLVDTVNVLTLVDQHLSTDIAEVKEYYSFLSDFVHPGFASNVPISDERLGEGITGPSVEQKKAAVEKVLQITGVMMKYLDHKLEDLASVGMAIEDDVQKALHPATTLDRFPGWKPEPVKRQPAKWQPPEEPVKVARGPLGGAVFFTKKGKTWLRY